MVPNDILLSSQNTACSAITGKPLPTADETNVDTDRHYTEERPLDTQL